MFCCLFPPDCIYWHAVEREPHARLDMTYNSRGVVGKSPSKLVSIMAPVKLLFLLQRAKASYKIFPCFFEFVANRFRVYITFRLVA